MANGNFFCFCAPFMFQLSEFDCILELVLSIGESYCVV